MFHIPQTETQIPADLWQKQKTKLIFVVSYFSPQTLEVTSKIIARIFNGVKFAKSSKSNVLHYPSHVTGL